MIDFAHKTFRRHGTAIAAVLLMSSAFVMPAHAEDRKYNFQIPAEDTAKALNDFARQAGVQIMFPYDLAVKHRTPAIVGQYSRGEVLAKLLTGSGLEVAEETPTSITLRAIAVPVSGPVVQGDEAITEVVVTGTHIRSGNPTSPGRSLSRKDIDRSGYTQVGDLIRTLPENFAGGQNPGVIAAQGTNSTNQNISNASSVNLRGLGSDATLVLLNGHRLPADSFYQGVDITGIPLGAIERIEIVPDGASAVYGSDVIAGVVNFITRSDFDGGQATASVLVPTQGAGMRQTYSLLNGISRPDWHVFANFEYEKQDEVKAGDRDRTAAAPADETLFQPQERRSLFLNFGRNLNSHVSAGLDVLVSDRKTESTNDPYAGYGTTITQSYTPGYNVAANLSFDLPGDWRLKTTAVASGSHTSQHSFGASTTPSYYRNKVDYVEAVADGALFELPWGTVKGAFGAGYREEKFVDGFKPKSTYFEGQRNVGYVFAEGYAPLVPANPNRVLLHELQLDASIRSESYSDFGSTTVPHLGLRYVPLDGLTIRTTWGKSFKAASFLQMYKTPLLYLYPANLLGGPASGAAMLTFGGNPDLKPERSTSWTFGADYAPAGDRGPKLTATYFSVAYKDRILSPIANLFSGLGDPLYAPFVESNPTAARQQELMSAAAIFINFTGADYDPTKVVAVLQDKYANATAQDVHGLDLGYRQGIDLSGGRLMATANGTWTHLSQQTLPASPSITLSGLAFYVPDFRGRGTLSWEGRQLYAAATLNYLSGETDNGVSPSRAVASWTTVDANLVYRLNGAGTRHGTKLSLSIVNLLDKSPPYVASSASTFTGITFDSTNTSIMGRTIALSISQDW